MTEEAILRHIRAGTCPWCERGPFLVLASHTHRAHGVDRYELRKLAGLGITSVICAPEISEHQSARWSKWCATEEGKSHLAEQARNRREQEKPHGTRASYRRGCHCPECRGAERQRQAAIRARRRVETLKLEV